MFNETQVLLQNTNVIHKRTWSLSMLCANADNIVVQCRINPKSTEKRGKIRGQMKKLFEIEIVTHRMAAILKTDLYSKLERLEHWKLSLRCANANSISRRRKQKTEN